VVAVEDAAGLVAGKSHRDAIGHSARTMFRTAARLRS
jgi:hypothetical protein